MGTIIATALVVRHLLMCDKSIAYFAIVVWPAYQHILGFATEYQRDVILVFCLGPSLFAPCIFDAYVPVTKLWPTYWLHKPCVWPRLSWVAKSLLVVAAASPATERRASIHTMEERRCSFIRSLLMDFCLYVDCLRNWLYILTPCKWLLLCGLYLNSSR